MSPSISMHRLVEDYLTARRALGFALKIEGRQLLAFARYADERRHRGPLNVELAVDWARSSSKSSPIGWARRLGTVSAFARYRALFDRETEIPPPRLLGPQHRRLPPHIYSTNEIGLLVKEAARLAPRSGLRPLTFKTIFGLLASTGLRVSEALRLTDADVDLDEGVLTIRETKFQKSRFVPLHPSAVRALRGYAHRRDEHVDGSRPATFFLLDHGVATTYSRTRTAFDRIRRRLKWNRAGARRAPRIHDLRHTFACRRLLLWQRGHTSPDSRIQDLATYLGHVKVTDTYWYLSAVPELMEVAGRRFERFARERGARS